MALLANLVPAPSTSGVFVPRPAATLLTAFGSFTAPGQGEALLSVGTRRFGMIASGRFSGKSEPFIYDVAAGSFVTVSGVTNANTPTSIATTGDWTPPTMARVGSRVVVTHPGFSGANFFGWFDMSGFSDNTHTGNTHTSTTVDTLSANVILLGWRPGMTISSSAGDIPANTTIVSIAANGLSLVLSQAATASNVGVTLTVAGGTNAAPLWCAGNTVVNALAAQPVAVAQFSGRAYFAVNNALAYSDSGDPLIMTNATQVITFQNGLNVTGLAGLPLNNQLGGIVQSLMAFQGAGNVEQITGDASASNLTVNTLNEAVGTLAPATISPTPLGLMFIAPDGLRLIDFNGHVSEPIGANGDGVAIPFINVTNPSRMCAAYNEDVYRVSVTGNTTIGGQVLSATQSVEYWYHLKLKAWTGPHSFPARLIVASQSDLSFTMFALTAGAIGLWASASLPTNLSSYIENGAQLSYTYGTCLLPDNAEMAMNSMSETTIALAVGGDPMTVSFVDDHGVILDQQPLPTNPASLWGSMIWGVGIWGGMSGIFVQRQIPWSKPLVFKQGQVQVTGPSNYAVRIGNIYMRYQQLGYQLQATG